MSGLSDELNIHKVKVNVGYTFNMENFESLRFDIGLEASGTGNPDATFKKVYDWCEKQLLEKSDEVKEELKK